LRLALTIAVGIGLAATAYFLLGRHGVGIGSPIGLAWPLAAALGLLTIVWLSLTRLVWDKVTVAMGAVASVSLAAVIILNLLPPIARDELLYHLAFPRLYVQSGRVLDLPFAKYSYYPMLVQMLYTPLIAYDWPQAAKNLHLLFGLASCALVGLYLAPRTGVRWAAAGMLLLLTTPTVLVVAASAYVDLALLFYATAALLGLLRWSETGQMSFLVLAGLASGLAASVKYNGLVVCGLLALSIPLLSQDLSSKRVIAALLAFTGLNLIPVFPWLVKNYWTTGNPVFPLLEGFVGGQAVLETPMGGGGLGWRRHLYGESWVEIALVPLRVFLTGREGDPSRFDGVFNPMYLLGVAAALRPSAPQRDRALLGFAVVFLALVLLLERFFSRFALPALVPLVVLTVEALQRTVQKRMTQPLLAVGAVAILGFNGAHFIGFWNRIDPLDYLLGRASETDFITRFVPEYPITKYANDHLPPDAVVYLAFLGNRGYHWQRPYTYDDNFLGDTLLEATRGSSTPEAIGAVLARKAISHVASADVLLDRYLHVNLSPEEMSRWHGFWHRCLLPIFERRDFSLRELRSDCRS
jgi:hypothetical protein